MDIFEFGAALIKTEDLDPVYCLYRAKLPEPQLCRLLFSYLSFYNLGVAAWLSEHEGEDYWGWMEKAAGLMYDSPRKALDQLATDQRPEALYNSLLAHFSAVKAPPPYDRYCNAQEVESVLCKMGSMKSGHYWVGKDIKEVREALHGWGETAHQILNHMPPQVAR